MPAVSGEPLRGHALVKIIDATSKTRSWHVSFVDISSGDDEADQPGTGATSWDQAPGASATLRLEWFFTELSTVLAAESFEVKVFDARSGTQIGDTWTGSITGDNGSVTRTFHFDDNPLNEASGTARWGMLEVYVKIIRTTATAYTIDSRGETTGTLGGTGSWARGYLRARATLSGLVASNASLGGAEPSTWAFPDVVFTRATLAQTCWDTGLQVTLRNLKQDNTLIRTETDAAAAGTQRDFTWDRDALGTTAKGFINKDYGNENAKVQVKLPTNTFGGDDIYAWADSGHAVSFTRDDNQTLTHATKMSVNPTLTIGSVVTGQSLYNRGESSSHQFGVTNARSEAITRALTWDLKDSAGVVKKACSDATGATYSDTYTIGASDDALADAVGAQWTVALTGTAFAATANVFKVSSLLTATFSTANSVYNRGESIAINVTVRYARGDLYVSQSNLTTRVFDNDGTTEEDTHTTDDTNASGVLTHTYSAGATHKATNDLTGQAKKFKAEHNGNATVIGAAGYALSRKWQLGKTNGGVNNSIKTGKTAGADDATVRNRGQTLHFDGFIYNVRGGLLGAVVTSFNIRPTASESYEEAAVNVTLTAGGNFIASYGVDTDEAVGDKAIVIAEGAGAATGTNQPRTGTGGSGNFAESDTSTAEWSVSATYTLIGRNQGSNEAAGQQGPTRTTVPSEEGAGDRDFTIGNDAIYAFAKVKDASNDPVDAVGILLEQIDPNGAVRQSATRTSSTASGYGGWTTKADGSVDALGAPFDTRTPSGVKTDAAPWKQKASVSPAHNGNTGSAEVAISMLSAYTANKNILVLFGPIHSISNVANPVLPTMPRGGAPGRPGDFMGVGLQMLVDGRRVTPDATPRAQFAILSFNQTASKVEALQRDGSWLDKDQGRTVTDGVLNATTTLTSATAAFVAGDAGKSLQGDGIPQGTIIQSVTNGTTVVMSQAATKTATDVEVTIGAATPYWFDFKQTIESLQMRTMIGTAAQFQAAGIPSGQESNYGYILDTSAWPKRIYSVIVKIAYGNQLFFDDEAFPFGGTFIFVQEADGSPAATETQAIKAPNGILSFSGAIATLGMDAVTSGADAAKPAAAVVGRVYIATDTRRIYRDDGAGWVEIARFGGNLGAGDLGFDPATQAELDAHAASTTGVHGVGAGFIAKTARSDQKPTLTVREFDGAPSFEATTVEGPNGAVAQGATVEVARLYYRGIDQVTDVTDYRRASGNGAGAGGAASEGFTPTSAGASVYVRDSVRMVLKGKCSPVASRSGFKITYNGVTYVEGAGADAGFIVQQGTSTRVGVIGADFTDTDNLLKARWYFGEDAAGSTVGITAVAPGSEASRSFTVESDGQAQKSVTAVVDRTAPVIDSFAFTGMVFGTVSGTPMRKGEYLKWTWGASDPNGLKAANPVTFSYPDGDFITGEATTAAASGTTAYMRTSSSAPGVGTRRIGITAEDLAGNVSAVQNITAHFEAAPAIPTINGISVVSGNAPPKTLHNANVTTSPDYTETSISADVSIGTQTGAAAGLMKCRNDTSKDDTLAQWRTSGVTAPALAVSGAGKSAVSGVATITAVQATVSSQSSALGLNGQVRVTDQYYQTVDATLLTWDYNANKTTDVNTEPGLVSPFGGLNRVYAETFYDGDAARILSKSSTKVEGGSAKRTGAAAGAMEIRVSIPANRSTNDQYGVKLRSASGELQASDGVSVEAKIGGAYQAVTLGSVFTGDAGATTMDLRLTWTSTGVDVAAAYVGVIE